MPTFDDTDELIDYIGSKFRDSGGVQSYKEQDDGTVIVAVTDTDFDPEGSTDDEETLKAFREAVEDGDVFGVIHFDRKGKEIDSLWGMAGYNGAKKAIQNYKDWHYTPVGAPKPESGFDPPIHKTSSTPAVPTPPPVRLSRPGEELSRNEDLFIIWMIEQGWYTERSEAIKHIERMRRSGARLPGDLQGLRPSLWHWERLGR